jgi:hypothetical protein
MTREEKEELLQEAKRRYPIGTKFISSMDSKHKGEIMNGSMYWWRNEDNDITANSSTGISVYSCGRWAEITYSPLSTVINHYSIY